MGALKCLGCQSLEREILPVKGHDLVVYDCYLSRFPYMAALRGLLKPSQGIARAAENCPEPQMNECLACGQRALTAMSRWQLRVCRQHYLAWSDWLDKHPDRRGYFSPGRRVIGSRWLEVFLEFVAEARGVKAPADP